METIHLKPSRKDLSVATPSGGRLAAAGEHVPFSTYWARRLRDGDVVKVPTITPAEPPQTAAGKSKKTTPEKG